MKKVSLALNVALTVAVIVLYILHFSGGNTSTENNDAMLADSIADSTETVDAVEPVNSKIGYINVDSLQAEYKLYTELMNKLKGREKRYSSELNNKMAALEQKARLFQEKAPTMSQFEGQSKQKELMEEEQRLYKMRDDFAAKFQNEQLKLDKQFRGTVTEYIEKYNLKSDYNIIIGASELGNKVLFFKEGINITDQIVEGLNEQYDEEKAAENKNKEAK